MQRKNGFININDLLNLDKLNNLTISGLLSYLSQNSIINIEKSNDNSQFVFSFIYNNDKYFFKYDDLVNPYNELVAYYIASDLKISSVPYDLAVVGDFKGVISKDFKVQGAKYIAGMEILKKFYKEKNCWRNNNLEDIWAYLEEYYQDLPNCQEIVKNLMYELVKLFIFDILTGQVDRHGFNWGIVEYANGQVNLQPIIDNSRIFIDNPELLVMQMNANKENVFLADSLEYFLDVSSSEFAKMFVDSLWVISQENLTSIFARIEKQTKTKIPDDIKENYRFKFRNYYNFFEDELNFQNMLWL